MIRPYNSLGGRVSKAFCQLCGQRISGTAKSYQHKKWPRNVYLRVCENCERTKPRCRICGIPVAATTPNGTCRTCSETLNFCLSCGEPIRGKYLEFDGVGPYCQKCYRERKPCEVCSAPLTDAQWRLSDGRVMCTYCHATAIYSAENAKALYEQMKSVATSVLGLSLNVPTGLALVDRNQLATVIKQQRELALAGGKDTDDLDPERTLGLYVRKGMRRSLYVQTGLPRLLFLQVAAHEFAHAWQGESCPLMKEPIIHEGFAEWVAYRVLGHYGYIRGQANMLTREDIYGRGLKWALDLQAKHGQQAVIEMCKRSV
jgi:hypothetical protein